ncbi:MAG: adenosylcobinamide amidohydrolase [Acidimicrobiales bacterium]
MRAVLTSRLEDDVPRDLLVWRLPRAMLCASSALVGGGVGARQWVVNAQVTSDYERVDIEEHVGELAAALELEGVGVGMLTAAEVRRSQRASDHGVEVEATVGLSHPAWAASDDVTSLSSPAGTINIVAFVPVRLEDGALLNALTTATEAKSQALFEAEIPATGTASDALCVLCPLDGETERFGGPRSAWGSRLARAVRNAVLAGAQEHPR